MTRFPSPGHLASWTGLCGRTIQSGSRTRNGKGQGNCLRVLGPDHPTTLAARAELAYWTRKARRRRSVK